MEGEREMVGGQRLTFGIRTKITGVGPTRVMSPSFSVSK